METVKTIDYGKALTWFINDKKFWPTVLTLSLYLLSCILIIPLFYVGPFMTGYLVKVIQNIQAGLYELPELDGGKYWQDGVTLLVLVFAVSMVLGIVMMVLTLGGSILGSILSNSSSIAGGLITLIANLVSFATQTITSLVFPLLYFVVLAIYAKTGSLTSLWQIENYRKVWQQNTWGIVISYVIYMAVVSALGFVGFLACCIGILPVSVASNFIMAGYIGQFAVEGVE